MMLAVQKQQEFRLTLKAEELARPSIGRGGREWGLTVGRERILPQSEEELLHDWNRRKSSLKAHSGKLFPHGHIRRRGIGSVNPLILSYFFFLIQKAEKAGSMKSINPRCRPVSGRVESCTTCTPISGNEESNSTKQTGKKESARIEGKAGIIARLSSDLI
jgi:hypothetical protein